MSEEAIRVRFFSRDTGFGQVMTRALGQGFEVRQCREFDISSEEQRAGWWNVVLLDLQSAEREADRENGFRLMRDINQMVPPPPVIAMIGPHDHAVMLKAMEKGAYDTVTTPPNMGELRLIIRRAHKFRLAEKELDEFRSQERSVGRLQELVGASDCMLQVFALAQKIAPCDVSVLITGETGTGKELLARAIHRLSPRAPNPFVAFSCASMPETLIEDELFGHEKGAFTGALLPRQGRFEAADKGTLFLDEVGDLGMGLQAKLLRVLQLRSFERLGSNKPITMDIRLVCATNKNLAEMVRKGTFREDLYYRLNVVQLHVPPLRERRDDVPFLAQHFFRVFAKQFDKKVSRFSRMALHALEEHDWPGNVRELENVVQRAVVLAEGAKVEIWNLPATLRKGFEHPRAIHSYDEEVRDFKRRLILRTLRQCSWRKATAARTLGMARGYLHRLINQLQIAPEPMDPMPNTHSLPPEVRRIM
jgi:DNA-binding NtrC family response regulator